MKHRLYSYLVAFAATGLFVGQPCWAGEPTQSVVSSGNKSQPLVEDIALQAGGVLLGQIVSPEEKTVGNISVELVRQGKTLGQTTTDEHGQFRLSGVRAGVYQIKTPYGSRICRLWAPRTAPPLAKEDVRLDTSTIANEQATPSDIVRGQGPSSGPVIVGDVGEGPGAGPVIVGGTLLGLGVWGIVELADGDGDDAPLAPGS